MRGKPVITMGDIARLAGVSKPTVSRALRDSSLVNEETKSRVLEVAKAHGYAVNRNAQNLRYERINAIAVSIDFMSHQRNRISDPFIFELLAGVSEALGNLNQDLLLCAPNHNDVDSLQHIILSCCADGIIFLGQGHREALLAELGSRGVPLVVWGARDESAAYCVVGSDNFDGGVQVGRYFLEAGRREILFVGDTTFGEIALRRGGLKSALEDSGKDMNLSDLPLSVFSYESAYNAIQSHFKSVPQTPDAIFAFSDTAAMACARAAKERGLSVPEDISIVGYNDIPAAAYFEPPITTIRQDTYQAGELLVAKLMGVLNGERPPSVTLPTELIVRAT